jgi:hypothetical protein
MISTLYTAIKDIFNYVMPRIKASWQVEQAENKLIVVNTSKKVAYNVQISYDENLFWTFSYKPQTIAGGSRIEINFSRITAPARTGYIYIKWTNERGNRDFEYKHQLIF